MAITDELREYTEEQIKWLDMTKVHYRKLFAIADRIDAEHAEAQRRWMAELDAAREQSFNAGFDDGFASADDWLAQHEDAMREHGWVKLPKDVNGELVDIGDLVDEMLPFGGYAKPAHVDTMELYRNANGYGWMVKLDAENRALISPKLLRHHKQPTVEDVLRDMHAKLDEVTALYVGEAIDSDERDRDEARIFAEYASKLRLAGEGDE